MHNFRRKAEEMLLQEMRGVPWGNTSVGDARGGRWVGEEGLDAASWGMGINSATPAKL